MKRMIAILLAVALVACGIVTAAATNNVTAMEQEYRNVLFSNGYRGFCVDKGLDEALVGDQFVVNPTSAALNNNTGEMVAPYLKAIFTESFHSFFVKNSQGVYELSTEKWDLPQRACWHFTDGYENYWEDISPIVEAAQNAVANGLDVPDSGYTKMVDETTEITFNFMLMETTKQGQQCFFSYQINQRTIDNNPPVEQPPVVETPTDTPEEPVVTPTEPVVTPTEPVVTPTEPVVTPTEPDDDTTKDNEDDQMGEDNQGNNPPIDPTPEDPKPQDPAPVDPKPQDPNPMDPQPEEQPKEEKPVVTPTDNPKLGETNALAAALFTLGAAATAFVVLKKRK